MNKAIQLISLSFSFQNYWRHPKRTFFYVWCYQYPGNGASTQANIIEPNVTHKHQAKYMETWQTSKYYSLIRSKARIIMKSRLIVHKD